MVEAPTQVTAADAAALGRDTHRAPVFVTIATPASVGPASVAPALVARATSPPGPPVGLRLARVSVLLV